MEQASTPTMRLAALTRTETAILAEFQDEMKARVSAGVSEAPVDVSAQAAYVSSEAKADTPAGEGDCVKVAGPSAPSSSGSLAAPFASSGLLSTPSGRPSSPLQDRSDDAGERSFSFSVASGRTTVAWAHPRETLEKSFLLSFSPLDEEATENDVGNWTGGVGVVDGVSGGVASLQLSADYYLDADGFLAILIYVICHR